jgi:hypothetical protein
MTELSVCEAAEASIARPGRCDVVAAGGARQHALDLGHKGRSWAQSRHCGGLGGVRRLGGGYRPFAERDVVAS